MNQEDKDILLRLLQRHKELGISEQIDYQKFYLYSIITHSTAIEGSTVTEVEAQLLFDEGITTKDVAAIYELSFWAHFELVTIHPWADGNGRTCRLLMNLLQMEFDVLPTKVLKEDKAEYIQALIDTREREDISIFINCMTCLHCQHLKVDIDHYLESISEKMVDKQDLRKIMVDKWSIKPSLAAKLVDILEFVTDKDEFTTEQIVSHFGFNATTAKRYLRQLTEFGYLEPHGGNKNRTYSNKKWNS